ncbi:MAG: hypothetical protein FWD12_12360, partial [Alphaproteobacteria bacterium]|nr:hypothetical protein [Alphaproteobacteria bacterium]
MMRLGLSVSLGAHLLVALLLLFGPKLFNLAWSQTPSAPPQEVEAEMVFVDPGRTPTPAASPAAEMQQQRATPPPPSAPPPSPTPPPSPPLPSPTP